MKVGANAVCRFFRDKLTLSSKIEIAMPDAAPEPANPIKCPLPMLLANNDAPTCKQNTLKIVIIMVKRNIYVVIQAHRIQIGVVSLSTYAISMVSMRQIS